MDVIGGVIGDALDHVGQPGVVLAGAVEQAMGLVGHHVVEGRAVVLQDRLGERGALGFRQAGQVVRDLLGRAVPGLGRHAQHVIAERLVRHHSKVLAGVFVRGQAILVGAARLAMPVELARLEEAQRFGAELPLDDRGHHKQTLLDRALAVQVSEGTQTHGCLARADAGAEDHALIGAHQLDGPLTLSPIRPGHGRLKEFYRLARLEVAPDHLHH